MLCWIGVGCSVPTEHRLHIHSLRASQAAYPCVYPVLCRIRTHLLAFEVYLRKRKLLLALAAVKGAHAAALAAGDPDAHLVTVRFARAVKGSESSEADQVRELFSTLLWLR